MTQEMTKQKDSAVEEAREDRRVFLPSVNVYEKEDHLLLAAEMPGVDENGVDVSLDRDVLTISGRSAVEAPADFQPAYREYAPGDYRRNFRLSTDQVDPEKIEADIKNGILRVKLPKKEAIKPRKITVRGE